MKKLITLFSAVFLALLILVTPVYADSINSNFESFSNGTVNSQDGWSSLGSIGSGCAVYDHAVVDNTYGFTTFGSKSLRISNAVTSGCFGDQTFAKSLVDAVGEVDSTDGTFSRGTLQSSFEMQFDLASAIPGSQQTGLAMSVSPDRGDGSRMSYLRFVDGTSGIDVFFDDVQGTTSPANFVETQIGAGLDRTVPHTIKLTMDMLDGPSNDVVKVWIDGVLKHTGTSWENYYRYDIEASAEQSPRIVKSVIFRSSGTAVPSNLGAGYLVDNVSLNSGPTGPVLVAPPTTYAQCKGNGWKIFNNPSFTSKSKCEKYVKDHDHKIKGDDVIYKAYNLKREVDLNMSVAEGGGSFEYDDANKGWYNVKVTSIKVDGNTGYFAGKVVKASNPAWVNQWLFGKVVDNGNSGDQIWGSFTDMTTAQNGVESMSNPADGPFTVTKKNITVN